MTGATSGTGITYPPEHLSLPPVFSVMCMLFVLLYF